MAVLEILAITFFLSQRQTNADCLSKLGVRTVDQLLISNIFLIMLVPVAPSGL